MDKSRRDESQLILFCVRSDLVMSRADANTHTHTLKAMNKRTKEKSGWVVECTVKQRWKKTKKLVNLKITLNICKVKSNDMKSKAKRRSLTVRGYS